MQVVDEFKYDEWGTERDGGGGLQLLRLRNLDAVSCGEPGCTAGRPQVIEPLTGELQCCTRPSITNILSAGYAFGALLITAAGILVATVMFMCGKRCGDVEGHALATAMSESASSAVRLRLR